MIEYRDMLFDWDDSKDLANQRKHGVSFSEAITVFSDEMAKLYDDEEHSEDEDRFILIGHSEKNRVLTVCHCYKETDTITRIISARKATLHERKRYEQGGKDEG